MEGRNLIIAVVVVVIVALVVVFWLGPSVSRGRLPTLEGALVGVEINGDGIARVGRLRLAAGTPFRLHAIVTAKTHDGTRVYYTDATTVRFEGADQSAGQPSPATVERWRRPEVPRVIWLTLEGAAPYRPLEGAETLERLQFEEFFHPEWGTGFTAPGSVEARRDESLDVGGVTTGLGFGTQHYQVWVELRVHEEDPLPASRLKSPGSAELLATPESHTAVEVVLEQPLTEPSRVFGLTQVEPSAESSSEVLEELSRRFRQGLLFSRNLLLKQLLDDAGTSYEDLEWRRVDLSIGAPIGESAEPGDLLRVGGRWVVLFRDAGRAGVLDGGDLAFDFDHGAVVRALSAVFVELEGESGDVEAARLNDRAGAR